jgi:hypothetical protein
MDLETLETSRPYKFKSPGPSVSNSSHWKSWKSQEPVATKILSLDAQLIKLCESNLTALGTCFVIRGGTGTVIYFSQKEVCVKVSACASICFRCRCHWVCVCYGWVWVSWRSHYYFCIVLFLLGKCIWAHEFDSSGNSALLSYVTSIIQSTVCPSSEPFWPQSCRAA